MIALRLKVHGVLWGALIAGCDSSPGITDGGASAALDGGTAGPVQGGSATAFRLTPGPFVPIRASLPRAANVDVVIRDRSGAKVLAFTQTQFPKGESLYLYGLCGVGSSCPQPTTGSSTTLPAGQYTAEIAADDDALQLLCAFTSEAATHSVTIRGNLDQKSMPTNFDAAYPWESSNFSTSVVVYSAVGNPIQLDIYYSKNLPAETEAGDSGDWTYRVLTDGSNLATEADGTTPATEGWPTKVAEGTLRFGTQGELVLHRPPTGMVFKPKDATHPQPIEFFFGTSTAAGGRGLDGLTQRDESSSLSSVLQDGTGPFIHCRSTDRTAEAGPAEDSTRNQSSGPNLQGSNVAIKLYEQVAPDYSGGPWTPQFVACVCQKTGGSVGGDISKCVPPPGIAPHLTKSFSLRGNLDETVAPAASFDLANPRETSSFDTSVDVFDSNDLAIRLDIYFSRKSVGNWAYHVLARSENLEPTASAAPTGDIGTVMIVAAGELRFDSEGRLISNHTTMNNFNPNKAVNPQVLSYDFGTGTESGGSGLDGITQYAAPSAIQSADVVAAFPKPCTLDLSGADAAAFRCWQVAWPQ